MIILASVTAVAVAAELILPGLLGGGLPTQVQIWLQQLLRRGDIATTVVGTGNIGYDDAMDVKIPNGLKIKRSFSFGGRYGGRGRRACYS